MTRTLRFGSWDEYWAVRNDPAIWLPYARQALNAAGLGGGSSLAMLVPSQYPTVRADNVVVTIYADRSITRGSYDMEVEAHSLVADRQLPIPALLAHGDFPPVPGDPQWTWLIESAASGVPWTTLSSGLAADLARRAASSLGAGLRRLHDTPHDQGDILKPDWHRFTELVDDELTQLGSNDARLDAFPAQCRPALRELAAATFAAVDTTAPTRLLHGDVHGDNAFFDATSGELTAIIDLNEMYAGDPWYDLADACFRLLRGEPPLVGDLLCGYGIATAVDRAASRLLGWGLLHDFDGLTGVIQKRGAPTTKVPDLAAHLTGLNSLRENVDGR